MKKMALFLFLLRSVQAHAVTPDFGFFCSQLLQKQPSLSDYSAYFNEDFQKAIPLESLKSIFSDLYADVGQCTSYKAVPISPGKYQLILSSDKQIDVILSVVFNEASGLFSSLLLTGVDDSSFQIQSWADLELNFQKLDPRGKFSATLKTSDSSVNLTHSGSEVFAVGSTFKLYILGALEQSIARGEHSWDEILPLKEEWKSLPSGIMHEWPVGKQVTLYEYAEKMISLSDNTATDHLLYFLGRDTVEKMLVPMGNNSHKPSFLPFLSTLELFKLKWAIHSAETQAYLQQDPAGRLNTLNSLAQVPRSQVGTNGVSLDQPTLIEQLEWFATTPENCHAMFWLAAQNNSQIRSILSKSVPLVPLINDVGSANSHWAYVGYKGGSEPGVFSMTFLLESKKKNRACLAMSWNNQTETISQNRLMDIVGKTLKLAETQVP